MAIEIYLSARKSAAALIAATLLSACAQQASQNTPQALDASIAHRFEVSDNTSTARNVILFVGDGMGVATVTAARIFDGQTRGETGEENSLSFESFDHLALIKTYNTNQQVSDSAGTATAMLSGVKTRAGVIGVGPEPQRQDCVGARQHALPSIADDVKAAGKAAGVVTTTRITHATPASLYAHSSERDYESDAYMSAERRANCVDIARQLLQFDSGRGLDVMFGGGYGEFVGKNLGGIRFDADADLVADWLRGDPARQFTQTADGLSKLNPDAPALGLFAKSHLQFVAANKDEHTQPSLAQMTLRAIELLDTNPNGYFLLVEGGRIDHGHHRGRAGLALTEAQQFSETIQAVLDAVDLGETLIMVTADHSHAMTLSGYPTRGNPVLGLVVANNDQGEPESEPKKAADGIPYASISYANGPGHVKGERKTPETGVGAMQQALVPITGVDRDGTVWPSETHGGEDVALYAQGPWAHLVGGVLEQNAIYHIMRHALGL